MSLFCTGFSVARGHKDRTLWYSGHGLCGCVTPLATAVRGEALAPPRIPCYSLPLHEGIGAAMSTKKPAAVAAGDRRSHQALELFERGMKALGKRDFERA